MKRKEIIKSFWRSVLSVIAMIVMVFLALSSIETTRTQTRVLENGDTEHAIYYNDGAEEVITGRRDGYNNWNGEVTIEWYHEYGTLSSRETVNMVNGKRHGVAEVYIQDVGTHYTCYEHGVHVECDKSGQIYAEETSGYELFSYNYPWSVLALNAMGYDDSYIQSYIDTLETLLFKIEFEEQEFDDHYDDVIDVLRETPYDSIISSESEYGLQLGTEMTKKSEFRMATIDGYREDKIDTYNMVESKYPNYLLKLSNQGVTSEDFQEFCSVYDSIHNGFNELDATDHFFVDSIDSRIFIALDSIFSGEKSAFVFYPHLKSALKSSTNRNAINFMNNGRHLLNQFVMDSSPKQVSEVVLTLILMKYFEADLIRKSVKQVWMMNNSVINLPAVTTDFMSGSSAAGVKLKGNVVEDGGATITSRGIAWAEFYNPTIDNNMIESGSGTGNFTVDLTELETGKTYYARTFATNSAGTAYGNCIEFIAPSATGITNSPSLVKDLVIYPNPTVDEAVVCFFVEKPKTIELSVADVSGRIVLQNELVRPVFGENQFKINTTAFDNGIYICRISADGEVTSAKLIVNR